ncbi:alpha/beta hydrolase family protein [Chitinimonas koreensis]|uniref:alpha/beta hydrolase family protein n=1 Tax=Chitinimonas koreensis TaxID=356302 RepID=UPI0004276815|nr:alpha/beta fold hydrolase [Chitinimonas koreensis]
MSLETTLDVHAADGYPLAARLYRPQGTAKGVVLLVSAMGVPQSFYAPLARWLAARGWAALSFDYRGMGDSRRGPLKALDVDLIGWAQRDCAALVEAARLQAPGKPLLWIGHSLGGQLPGLTPNIGRVDRIVTVAAGSGYWLENAWPLKRRAWLFWFVFAPILTPLFGYFPGKRLGMVGDLPAGVMRQWRRWCLHRDYAVGVEGQAVAQGFAAVRAPVLALGIEDDEMMSRRNTESLHGLYRGAAVALRRVAPAEHGLARIGHFGFFRKEHATTLWPRLIGPELAALEAEAPKPVESPAEAATSALP